MKAGQPETAGIDHLLNVLVGRRTGLDAVDLAAELLGMRRQVLEVLDAALGDVVRHRERELGAGEVGPHHLNGLGGREIVDEALLRRHPVAEEHVELAVLHGLIADRH